MDIRNKFKQGLAAMGTVALLATSVFSGAGVALAAGTFPDDDGQWYEADVEFGVTKGIWDKTQTKFRGADLILRAEAATTMVRVVDGLAGFTAPAKATFVDVPAVGSATEQWYSKYMEASASLGIITGDKTPQGTPTGFARPTGSLTRAEAAAVVVRAFELSTENNAKFPETFSDVNSGDWFASVMQTAYANGVVKGENGLASPNRPVNRAEMAAMIARAYKPTTPGGTMACAANEYMDKVTDTCKVIPTCKAGEYFNETTAMCEVVTTSTGTLELKLGANTPAGANLPLGAQNVELFDFDLKAVGDAVQVTQILVTRLGVGDVTDWDAVYLYEGDMRITSERTFPSDTNQAIFNLSKFIVPADKTRTLTLVGNVSTTATNGNTHMFSVTAATDVKANAKSVTGTFPVTSKQFSFSGVSVGSATFDAVTISEPSIGEKDAEIGAFKLTASGANDVLLERITLTQNGSFDAADFSKLRLLAGSDEVATAESFDGDTVTFVLKTPYKLDSGQNRTFFVRGDINGGKTTETIELYLDFDADAKVIDDQYGFGAQVINNSLNISSVTAVNLQGGDITIVDTSAPSTQIAVNSTNQAITKFQMTAALDVLVRDTQVMIQLEDSANQIPNIEDVLTSASADSVAATLNANEYNINTAADADEMVAADMIKLGSSYARVVSNDTTSIDGGLVVYSVDDLSTFTGSFSEVNPYSFIKNVKLVDTKDSNTLAGPLSLASQGTKSVGADNVYTKVFTEDYDLMAGETRDLAVMVDIDQNMVSGYRIQATVTYPESSIKDQNANEFVALEEIVGSPLAGNLMTIEESTLTVSRSSSPISQEYVLGQQAVNALGLSIQAGDAGDNEIRKIIVRVYGDDGGTQFDDLNGDASANLLVSSVSLYNGNTLVSGPKGLSATGTAPNDYDIATFDQLNLIVKKGETLNLMVKANLLNTKTGMVAFDVVPSTDIIAEDSDNNTINLSSTAVNTYAANHFAVEHEIIDTGTLTVDEIDSPSADIAVAGTNQMLVSSYHFNAVDEAFDVNKLTVINDTTGPFGDALSTSAVQSVTIKYPNAQGVIQTKTVNMTSGSANFSGLDFIVPKNDSAKLEIYANVAPLAQPSLSGLDFRLGLRDTTNTQATFEAVGMASSNTITSGIVVGGGANVEPFTLRKTVPTFTQETIAAQLTSNEMELYDVTVKADTAGSVYLARMVFDITTFFETPANADLADFYVKAGNTKLQDADVNIFCTDSTGASPNNIDELVGTTTSLEDCDGANGTLTNGTYKVIVSFDQPQTIGANSSKRYSLWATVAGATGDADNVQVRLATGDEFVALSGLNAEGNENTGKIYAAGDTTNGIYTAAATSFSQNTASAARNFLWSDGSAQPHQYPTLTDGSVGNVTGSADWTNGYQLEIDDLKSRSLNTP